ncbi:hypothetical protein [Chryseobacterium ginsenosidimutans]|uniref:hypothetical protein n=1 Tax=Chryseobacterium ginsenosidimutans TaxID=687846 RepID=UPI003593D586
MYYIMSNHVYLFCRADGKYTLSEIMRYLKNSLQKNLLKLCNLSLKAEKNGC